MRLTDYERATTHGVECAVLWTLRIQSADLLGAMARDEAAVGGAILSMREDAFALQDAGFIEAAFATKDARDGAKAALAAVGVKAKAMRRDDVPIAYMAAYGIVDPPSEA